MPDLQHTNHTGVEYEEVGEELRTHVRPLMLPGITIKLVYRNAQWEYPTGDVADLTGRQASVEWEGTALQIPAQGVGDNDFRIGDTALVRSEPL